MGKDVDKSTPRLFGPISSRVQTAGRSSKIYGAKPVLQAQKSSVVSREDNRFGET